ncbi:hypothetical protein NHX12_009098 [Muraenolepis orangiensis]|uniref:Uncharacterized protein n=1 Tax=Muraenolepis orangiensis TaxID=630683 RepID=A0A9Q0DP48_9TELE|nr:hypothetical protein NHX12_009098 [Muraenolepis orangiensis]
MTFTAKLTPMEFISRTVYESSKFPKGMGLATFTSCCMSQDLRGASSPGTLHEHGGCEDRQQKTGGGINIIEAAENLKAFQKKLPLWKRRTKNDNFANFPLLDDCESKIEDVSGI